MGGGGTPGVSVSWSDLGAASPSSSMLTRIAALMPGGVHHTAALTLPGDWEAGGWEAGEEGGV